MPKEKKETTIETQIVEYVITPATIEAMKKKYSGMKITDAISDKAVRAARNFMVTQRTAVDKWRIEQNEEANDWRHRINQKAKEITALLLPIEEPLQAEVKRVDDEREAKREEKDRLEKERKEGIQAKIAAIFNRQIALHLADLVELRELSSKLEDMEIKEAEYMEFTEEAEKVLEDTYSAIQDAITARIKLDEEAESRKAEDARLEKVRKKQEADQDKIDAANKKLKDDKAKLEADKQAEDDRKEKEAFEKTATEKAEAAAAQKVIDDAKEKDEKERAEEVEKERKAAMAPDKEKLTKWIYSFNETAIPTPSLKTKKAKEILRVAKEQLEILLQDTFAKVEKL